MPSGTNSSVKVVEPLGFNDLALRLPCGFEHSSLSSTRLGICSYNSGQQCACAYQSVSVSSEPGLQGRGAQGKSQESAARDKRRVCCLGLREVATCTLSAFLPGLCNALKECTGINVSCYLRFFSSHLHRHRLYGHFHPSALRETRWLTLVRLELGAMIG